jgi:hypothetical protein
MAALDFKKQDKDLYLPPKRPVLIDVPEMNFLMVDGSGDPNSNPEFENAVGALYAMSYTLKMLPKKGIVPAGYVEYSVAPLEGLWWLADGDAFNFTRRGNWLWTVLIRQPDFVTDELVAALLPEVMKKKPNAMLEKLRFQSFTEGLCVQMMHLGPYVTEPGTVECMDVYTKENNLLSRLGQDGKHHEIYLSDPNKGKPENMKTVLRHPVATV